MLPWRTWLTFTSRTTTTWASRWSMAGEWVLVTVLLSRGVMSVEGDA